MGATALLDEPDIPWRVLPEQIRDLRPEVVGVQETDAAVGLQFRRPSDVVVQGRPVVVLSKWTRDRLDLVEGEVVPVNELCPSTHSVALADRGGPDPLLGVGLNGGQLVEEVFVAHDVAITGVDGLVSPLEEREPHVDLDPPALGRIGGKDVLVADLIGNPEGDTAALTTEEVGVHTGEATL